MNVQSSASGSPSGGGWVSIETKGEETHFIIIQNKSLIEAGLAPFFPFSIFAVISGAGFIFGGVGGGIVAIIFALLAGFALLKGGLVALFTILTMAFRKSRSAFSITFSEIEISESATRGSAVPSRIPIADVTAVYIISPNSGQAAAAGADPVAEAGVSVMRHTGHAVAINARGETVLLAANLTAEQAQYLHARVSPLLTRV